MLNIIHDPQTGPPDEIAIDIGIVDSKRLQMFYASVKEGSFAGAAQILSISPSAISHAMKGLEEDFGCALFRRFGPQVKPTITAIRLMPMVKDLLVRMAQMKGELAALNGRSESLIVRLPMSLMGMLQSGVLSTFCECFPAANLEIFPREASTCDAVEKHPDFDIAYLQQLPNNETVSRHLADERFHAYVAPFHTLCQKGRISMGDLRRSLLIFPDQFTFQRTMRQLDNGVCGALRKWILPDIRVANELARQGQGIAFLPERAVRTALQDGTLVSLNLPGFNLHRNLYACWDPCRPLTWMAEVFLSLFEEKIEPK